MRLILYIFLSFLIVSCGTNKNLFHKKDKVDFVDRDGDLHVDVFDIQLDSTQISDIDGDGIPDSEDRCPTWAGYDYNGGCPEVVMMVNETRHPASFTSVEYDSSRDIQPKPKKETYVNGVENMDIVDNTNSNNDSKGTIAYSVPNEMQVGKEYVIKLRISKERGKEINNTLVLGDRNIPISDVNIDSKVTIENIRVEKTMTAELISADGNFKVTPQNTDKQIIEDGEYTEWGWLVTPLKSGRSYLKLIIKIKIDTDGEVSYKDIVVFDKDIKVKANATFAVKTWLAEYWQWLMTTIIIPLVVWFFKRKKKGEEEEEKEETEE